jgi:polypeptide N-acetylgalactosaminyltransferase
MLLPIRDDPTKVVCPIIDMITPKKISYMRSGGGHIGAFSWGLNFNWKIVPERENVRRRTPTDGYRWTMAKNDHLIYFTIFYVCTLYIFDHFVSLAALYI